jgi:hypothetical protein
MIGAPTVPHRQMAAIDWPDTVAIRYDPSPDLSAISFLARCAVEAPCANPAGLNWLKNAASA